MRTMKSSHHLIEILACAAIVGGALAGCNPADTGSMQTATFAATGGATYDAKSIVVKFKSVPSIESTQSVLGLVSGTIVDKNNDGKDDHYLHVSGGLLAKVELGSISVEQALNVLKSDPRVEYAEPNWIVQLVATPNDPRFTNGDLWGLHNTGQNGGTADADIDAPEAWDMATGDSNVVVGVIDTGVEYDHEDLAGNMWTNPGENCSNGTDDDGNGWIDDCHGINAITGTGDPRDDHDHGSHCSGTIGGKGNNGIGVVGVNWDVGLAACKFLNSFGSGNTADAITCVDYFVDLKTNRGVDVRVLSNSWGGGGFSQAMEDAIAAADNADILFVAAAGNDGTNNDSFPHYPSNYNVPNVFSIAATDRNDNKSSFSNYGPSTVHLGAPGSAIWSSVTNNSYASFSGTSMATPHVAGAAALVASVNPALTDTEIKNLLMNSGDNIGGNWASGNRLNLNQAIIDADPQPTFRLSVSPSSQTISQGDSTSYTVTADALNGYSGVVSLSLSSTPALNATTSFSPTSIDLTTATTGTSTLTITTSTATTATSYNLSIDGTDGTISKSSGASLDVNPEGTVVRTYNSTDTPISIPDNDPTGITSTLNVPDSLTMSSVDVTVNITHTWIGDLIVRVTSPAGTTVTLHDRSGGSADNINQTYNLPSEFDNEDSQGNWQLFVSDNAGLDLGTLDNWSLEITGVDNGGGGNNPPTAGFTHTTSFLTATFTDTSTDSDGTIVSWDWDFGDGNTSSAQNPTHTYAAAGTYTVTLTVTDNGGATDSFSDTVTVTDPPAGITLTIAGTTKRGKQGRTTDLTWIGATSADVDIYRDGNLITTTANDGAHSDKFRSEATSFVYQVCEAGTSTCSNEATANF